MRLESTTDMTDAVETSNIDGGSPAGGTAASPAPGRHAQGTRCVRCQETNPQGRKFCGSCGGALYLPCASCKQVNAVDERFCAGCGANLAELFLKQWSRLHGTLISAWEACRQAKFDSATRHLEFPDAKEDPRLELFVNASQLLTRVVEQRRIATLQAVEIARSNAGLARENSNIPELVNALRSIPVALRDDAIERELRYAESALVELQTLRSQVSATLEAVKSKRAPLNAAELLIKVRRVMELDPADTSFAPLVEKLTGLKQNDDHARRKAGVQQAKECLAQHDYINALRHIEGIPRAVWDEKLQDSHASLKELAWLESELRFQPFVSQRLLHFAKKLTALRGDDTRAVAWRDRLQQQLASGGATAAADPKSDSARMMWTRAPEKTKLGPPIRPIHVPRTVTYLDAAAQSHAAAHMSEFTVAYGLALQGLGLGEIDLNLISSLRKSTFGKLFGKSGSDLAWGLDVGACGIKVVCLAKTANGVNWVAADVFEHATPLIRIDTPDARTEMIQGTLAQVQEKHSLKTGEIGLSVAGHRSLGRFFLIPPVDAKSKNSSKRVKDLIRFEAEAQVPFPLDEVYWDAHVFGEASSGSETKAGPQSAALVAARVEDVKELLAAFEKSGVKPGFVQAECFALYNVLSREALNKPDANAADAAATSTKGKRPRSGAIIEVGCQSTSIVIGSNSHVWFRSFAFAGEEFTRRIVRGLKVTHAQADAIKHEPWKAKRVYTVAEALDEGLNDWSGEVSRTLMSYHNANPKHPVTHILLSGGGSQTLGVARRLIRGE